MADCTCINREPGISVAEWREVMGVPADCELTAAQEGEIYEALLQADEDVARYAGWWPSATEVCEEIPVAIRYGGCQFTRAGASRWVTLAYGKVQSVLGVEFLRRGAAGDDSVCYVASPGAICVLDSDYGSVELADNAAAGCGCPQDIERVRIRYISGGDCDGEMRWKRLLSRYAATLLCSPFLCGVDLRCDGWDLYSLSETTQTDEFQRTTDDGGGWKEVVTTTTVTNTKEQRLPQNPRDYESPFGHTRAGVQLWRFLSNRRRLRAYRL